MNKGGQRISAKEEFKDVRAVPVITQWDVFDGLDHCGYFVLTQGTEPQYWARQPRSGFFPTFDEAVLAIVGWARKAKQEANQ